jgi:glycosyltransferase involved in cell wall biosynthesis
MTSGERPRLSVLIITLNEERLLEQVLESVRWADEIIIVDSGSTDRTEEIARRFTSHFHVQAYAGHGNQRRRSFELSTGDWILYIDADEVVTDALVASIRAAIAKPGKHNGFRFQLHTWFLGQWFGTKGWRKEWKVRLFRRDRGVFNDLPIHEGASVEGPIGTIAGALLHFPYADIAHYVHKMNRYSTAMAALQRAGGSSSSPWSAAIRGASRFLRDFIGGGDFLYGPAGFVRSSVAGYYTFLKYAKVWEDAHSTRFDPPLPTTEPNKDPP